MGEFLLTIAMPTFNHHDDLRKQLECLIPQLNDQVRFIILDNCSEPPVSEYFQNILTDHPEIELIRNSTNIGGDANIFNCFKICKTEWVWVLSNNDFISKDAVSVILNVINSNKSAVFINWGYPENCSRLVKGFYEFCKYADYGYSFAISFCLYNMTKLNKYLDFYSQTTHTNQPQLLFILKYLKENNNEYCYFTDINIFQHLTPSNWSKKDFILNTLSIYSIIDKEDINFFKETIGHQIIYTLLHHLVISRLYEGLGLTQYIRIFFKILKKAKINDLVKYKKIIFLYFICIFFPKTVYKQRKKKILPDMDYEKNNLYSQ